MNKETDENEILHTYIMRLCRDGTYVVSCIFSFQKTLFILLNKEKLIKLKKVSQMGKISSYFNLDN